MKKSLAEGSLTEGSLTAPAIIIIIFYFIPVGIIDEGENLQKVVQHSEKGQTGREENNAVQDEFLQDIENLLRKIADKPEEVRNALV